jgi:hypothetical protein
MKYLVLVGLLSGCGVDRNIDNDITIDHGVYGLLVKGCDTSGCVDQVDSNESVMIIGSGDALATVTSDGDGVYQVSLPADTYQICTYSCTQVTVPDNGTIRADWTSGPGGGNWDVSQN